MKLQDAREHYYFHTGKVSEIARQLAFAAIAVIWLFKAEDSSSVLLPAELLQPLKLVVICLALDLLQYLMGTIGWGLFQSLKERSGVSESDEFKAPRAINWAPLICFWSKIAVLAYAYFQINSYLRSTIALA
jgi:hypothetical protein